MLQHDGEHGSFSGEWQCHRSISILFWAVLFCVVHNDMRWKIPIVGRAFNAHTEHAVFPSQSDAVERLIRAQRPPSYRHSQIGSRPWS